MRWQATRVVPDSPSDDWMAGGRLLRSLCGVNEDLQTERIMLLARACQRVVAAQPALVKVGSGRWRAVGEEWEVGGEW